MPSLDEKRGTQSQQILKAGKISFDGSGIDCIVRKMSAYGANLEVESQIGIPNSFDLVIVSTQSTAIIIVALSGERRVGSVSRSIRKSRRER
jgi:hypothetical protein